MSEQIRIEEKVNFYIEEKTIAEQYKQYTEKQGYKARLEEVSPKGYIVTSVIWLSFDNK